MSVKEHDRPVEAPTSGLDVFYAAAASADRWLRDDSVIALVRFGSRTHIDSADPRQMSIALPPVGENDTVEVWRTGAPIARGREGDLYYAVAGEALFGHVLVEESASGGISAAAHEGYWQILRTIEALGYPHLVRVWNYFPAINVESDGLERYRAFCVGRYDALAAVGFDEQRLAAASAIGTRAPGLLLYFLAAREPGTPIENPRQVSAYHYPSVYGPRRPQFSRAILKRWGGATQLFISGTASVVGHRTFHETDAVEQLRETVRNLEALLAQANRVQPLAINSPGELGHIKVYLRRPEDVAVNRDLDHLLGASIPRVYLHADICRAGLLLEIDGFYSEATRS